MDEEDINDQALMSRNKKKAEPIARKVTQEQQETEAIDGPTGR